MRMVLLRVLVGCNEGEIDAAPADSDRSSEPEALLTCP